MDKSDNAFCPDFESHSQNAADQLYPAGIPADADWTAIDAAAEVEYLACQGH